MGRENTKTNINMAVRARFGTHITSLGTNYIIGQTNQARLGTSERGFLCFCYTLKKGEFSDPTLAPPWIFNLEDDIQI